MNDMITIETNRGGAGLQTFTFESRDGMYLEATDELPEPHEFDAVVSTVHDGHAHSYDLQFKEHDHGHVVPADHAANDAGGHSHGSGEHRHGPGGGNPVIEAMYHLFPWLPGARGHGHAHSAANIDSAMETSAEGIRAVQQSLIVLGLTALAQVIVVVLTGSVALLADTIHNFGDALTAVPSGSPSR